MKLFVWRGKDVLRDYSSGIVFALAFDVEQARNLVLHEFAKEYIYDNENWWMDDEQIEERHKFLSNDPEVFENPIAIYKEGGE